MNKKISMKLFGITALFFILLISAFMAFQSLIFESYYENRKTREFEENFRQLYSQLQKEGLPEAADDSPDYLEAFEDKNNSETAAVLVTDGLIQILMLGGNNENQKAANFLFKRNIKEKDQQMEYLPTDGSISLPVPGIPAVTPSNANRIIIAFHEYLAILETRDKETAAEQPTAPAVFTSGSTEDGVRSIAAAVPLGGGNNDSKVYLLAVSSLQPVGEAVSVIRDLYIYFAAIAVILILLLAFVFSNMVSKPLIKLNAAAVKMAGLDLSATCEVNRSDEIGSLARNLNFLSVNLHNALSDLKDANSRLTEDIQKERQLEKMRKEFVAGVSHELKTPIGLIMGYAEGLKESLVEGEDRDRYLGVISDEARKMGNLVNDMLDLSQLESGKFRLYVNEFFIDELVRYTARKYETLFASRKLKTELNIPQDNLLVNADEFRLEQVLNNFISNAIRHTPEGGMIRINVFTINNVFDMNTEPEAEKMYTVRVEVENQGSPIAETELDNIWLKFYKAEKSRNRETGGTGLGLAIAGSILELHGASYGAENTADGVRFYFELDVDREDVDRGTEHLSTLAHPTALKEPNIISSG